MDLRVSTNFGVSNDFLLSNSVYKIVYLYEVAGGSRNSIII